MASRVEIDLIIAIQVALMAALDHILREGVRVEKSFRICCSVICDCCQMLSGVSESAIRFLQFHLLVSARCVGTHAMGITRGGGCMAKAGILLCRFSFNMPRITSQDQTFTSGNSGSWAQVWQQSRTPRVAQLCHTLFGLHTVWGFTHLPVRLPRKQQPSDP